MKTKLLVIAIILSFGATQTFCQSVNDFRSHQGGNWNNLITWEKWNGTSWVNPSPVLPSATSNVLILAGHGIIANQTVNIDEITVMGTLTGSASFSLTTSGKFICCGTVAFGSAGGNITIGDSLIINGGTFTTGSNDLNVNSSTMISSGSFNDNNDNGTDTFSGILTVENNAIFSTSLVTSSNHLVYKNGILQNSTGSILINGSTFNTNQQTILIMSQGNISFSGSTNINSNIVISGTGSGSISFQGNTIIGSNCTMSNQRVVNISGQLNGTDQTSVWLNDTNSELKYTNNNMPMINGILNASAKANICMYNRTAGAQLINGTTYYNLIIDKSGQTGTLNNNTVILGDLSILSGILNVNNHTLELKGSYFNNGSLDCNSPSSTILMSGNSPQVFNSGTCVSAYISGFEVNNQYDVTLGNSLIINDTLFLTKGRLILGTFNLTLNNSAVITGTFSSSEMIVTDNSGELIKNYLSPASSYFTFPVGSINNTAGYSPAVISLTANGSGSVSVRVNNSKHQDILFEKNYLSRYWSFTTTYATYSYSASFSINSSDTIGNTSNMKLCRWDPGHLAWYTDSSSFLSFPVLSSSLNLNNYNFPMNGADFTGKDGNSVLFYRAKNNGNWNSINTWECSDDSLFILPAPVQAVYLPNNINSNKISVSDNHLVSLSNNTTADDIFIENGSELDIAAGGTLNIANGKGTDLTVAGVLKNSGGNIINSGTTTFLASGKYIHARDGGTVPAATWNKSSVCEITGIITSTAIGGLSGQAFGCFEWNCPSQSNSVNLQGTLVSVNGDLDIINTGQASEVRLTGNTPLILNVLGDFNIVNGTLDFCNGGSGTGTMTLNIFGNYYQASGVFKNSSISAFNILSMNFCGYGKTFFNAGTFNSSHIDININDSSSLELLSDMTISAGRSFTIGQGNSGVLDCGQNSINGAGIFKLNNYATLIIGSPAGLSSTGLTGNVRNTGTRIFSSDGSYLFDGLSAQTTGDFMTITSPSAFTLRNLTINNPAGVTIPSAIGNLNISNQLVMACGILHISSPNLVITMKQGSSTAGSPSNNSYVSGPIRKIGNSSFIFPVGADSGIVHVYAPLGISAPLSAIDTFTVEYHTGNPPFPWWFTNAHLYTSNLDHVSDREWWTIKRGFGTTSEPDITLFWNNGNINHFISDLADLRVANYNPSISKWENMGRNVSGTATQGSIQNSYQFSGYGQVTFGSEDGNNSLPVELIELTANCCDGDFICINWSTLSETNNNFFAIEKSIDLQSWDSIGSVKGSCYSDVKRNYSFVLHQYESNTLFFRLKQEDYDGNYKYSANVAVNCKIMSPDGVKIFPNPFEDELSFEFSNYDSPVIIDIFDITGRIIKSVYAGKIDNNMLKLNLKNLITGIYIISIKSGSLSKKFKIAKI